jgi:hypothetical protein
LTSWIGSWVPKADVRRDFGTCSRRLTPVRRAARWRLFEVNHGRLQ